MRSIPSVILLALVTGVVLMPAAVRAVEAPEPLPQAGELHRLFKDGKYPPLLQKLARVLALKGDAARPYDRVEMLLLRGDALLQLKQTGPAVEAMGEAVKSIDDQTDPKLAAVARATELLVKRSRGLVYTPKTAPKGEVPKPVSVLDVEQRKTAFWGLYNDMKQETAARVKAAKAGKTLVPIVEAIRGLSDFRAVELSATDNDEQSQGLLADLSSRAEALMSQGVAAMARRASDIDVFANQKMANLPVAGQATFDTTYHKRGLDFNTTRDLKAILGDCERVAAAAKDFAEQSKANSASFGRVAESAEKTLSAARRTLEADYNGVFGPG